MIIFDTLNLDLSYWAPLLAIVAVGGIMRGFAGFGATMVMVPFLSLLMSPKEAVLLALSTDVLVMTPMFPKAAKKAEWKPVIPIVIGAFFGDAPRHMDSRDSESRNNADHNFNSGDRMCLSLTEWMDL